MYKFVKKSTYSSQSQKDKFNNTNAKIGTIVYRKEYRNKKFFRPSETGIIINIDDNVNDYNQYFCKILILENKYSTKAITQIVHILMPIEQFEEYDLIDINTLSKDKINSILSAIDFSFFDQQINSNDRENMELIKLNCQNILDSKFKSTKENTITNISTITNNNYKRIKALAIFENINDFFNKVKNLYDVENWKIQSNSYEERANSIKNYTYFNILKECFNSSNLTNKNVTDAQIISFLDTLSIMYKVFSSIDEESIVQEMKIIMEYVIPELSKPRIDYILTFRNSMILIEFSKTSTIENLSNETTKKTQQLIGYTDMLKSNITNKNINIIPHVCMYFDNSNEKNNEITKNTIINLQKKIYKVFKNDELKNAFEILSELD